MDLAWFVAINGLIEAGGGRKPAGGGWHALWGASEQLLLEWEAQREREDHHLEIRSLALWTSVLELFGDLKTLPSMTSDAFLYDHVVYALLALKIF